MLTAGPQYAESHVLFNGLAKGVEVCIYTADGRLVGRQQAGASGYADVSLESLPKGVYVVRTPDNSIKITCSVGFCKSGCLEYKHL